MLPENVERLPHAVDLSETSLEWALEQACPPLQYCLHVHPGMRLVTQQMLRKLGAQALGNPLVPYFNVVPDPALSNYEWYLVVNGKAVGSTGAL